MAKNKFNMQVSGFDYMLHELEEMNGNVLLTAKRMCLFPARIVTKQIQENMKKHEVTGDTANAIITPKEYFDGTRVYSEFGFDLDKPNVAIVFLEKGTPERKKKPVIAPAVRTTKKDCLKMQQSTANYFFQSAMNNRGN